MNNFLKTVGLITIVYHTARIVYENHESLTKIVDKLTNNQFNKGSKS